MNMSDVNIELDVVLVLDHGNAVDVTHSVYLSYLMEMSFKQFQN